jgi:predicted nucleic acid-binding protein
MARYAIDAPALLRIVADDLDIDPTHQLVAPKSIRSDVMALLYVGVRRGELVEEEALAIHDEMTGIKLRLLDDRVSRRTAWKLASEHGWSNLHGAQYIAVARLQADALVCLDQDLRAAASGVVEIAPLDDLLVD